MNLEAYRPPLEILIHDALRALVMGIWVLFVLHYISRYVYNYYVHRLGEGPARYISRKIVHIVAGGLVALSIPFLFREPWIPTLAGFGLALYTYLPHRKGKLMYWFQDPSNISEVYYCISWSLAVIVSWAFNVWIGIFPLFLMSFGDGVTGIIRGFRHKKRVKSLDGTVGFLAVSLPLGYLLFGVFGLLVTFVSAFVEKLDILDDNIGVPLVSLSLLIIAHLAGVLPQPVPF